MRIHLHIIFFLALQSANSQPLATDSCITESSVLQHVLSPIAYNNFTPFIEGTNGYYISDIQTPSQSLTRKVKDTLLVWQKFFKKSGGNRFFVQPKIVETASGILLSVAKVGDNEFAIISQDAANGQLLHQSLFKLGTAINGNVELQVVDCKPLSDTLFVVVLTNGYNLGTNGVPQLTLLYFDQTCNLLRYFSYNYLWFNSPISGFKQHNIFTYNGILYISNSFVKKAYDGFGYNTLSLDSYNPLNGNITPCFFKRLIFPDAQLKNGDFATYSFGGYTNVFSKKKNAIILAGVQSYFLSKTYEQPFRYAENNCLYYLNADSMTLDSVKEIVTPSFINASNSLRFERYSLNIDRYGSISALYGKNFGRHSTDFYRLLLDSTGNISESKKKRWPSNFPKTQISSVYQILNNNKVGFRSFSYYFNSPPTTFMKFEESIMSSDIIDSTFPCSESDTSFATIRNINFLPDTGTYLQQVTPLPIFPINDYFTLQDAAGTFTTDTICYKKNECVQVHINGVATTCTNADNRFTATRTQCNHKIYWQWQDGGITYTHKTDTAQITWVTQGVHTVRLYSAVCNQPLDSLTIMVNSPSLKALDLGKDTVFCKATQYTLQIPGRYKTALWNTGDSSFAINITKSGIYSVSVQDSCGNVYTDSINLIFPNKVLQAGAGFNLCRNYDTLITANAGFSRYYWQGTGILTSPNQSSVAVQPVSSGYYKVMASDNYNCSYEDSLYITLIDCPRKFDVPTAFTPNNDGLNDVFKPILQGRVASYQFMVFNRWGQAIYSSKIPEKGWDGTYQGALQPSGTFTWQCQYRFIGGSIMFAKGTVVLIY